MSVGIKFRLFGKSALYSGVVDRAVPPFGAVSRIGKVSLRSAAPHLVRYPREDRGEQLAAFGGFGRAVAAGIRTFGRGSSRTSIISHMARGGTLASKAAVLGRGSFSLKSGVLESQWGDRILQRGGGGTSSVGTRYFAASPWEGLSGEHAALPAWMTTLGSSIRKQEKTALPPIGTSAGQGTRGSWHRTTSMAPRGMAARRSAEPDSARAAEWSDPSEKPREHGVSSHDWATREAGRSASGADRAGSSDPERLVDVLSEFASRPPRGVTGIDPRLGPIYPGGFGRQW